jgi:hypothetical protein
MGKLNVILPYKRSVGFPNINHLYHLKYNKKSLNNIRKIILTKINKEEYKHNRIPWPYWLIICLSLGLMIGGIAAISWFPYNYVMLSFGIIMFLAIGILFCVRFGRNKNFVDAGLKAIEQSYGNDIEIFKVFEKSIKGKTPTILKAVVFKLKRDKKKMKNVSKNHDETESTLANINGLPSQYKDPFTRQNSDYNDIVENPAPYKSLSTGIKQISKKSIKKIGEISLDKNHYGITESVLKKSQKNLSIRNNLRMHESDFAEVAPEEDSFQLRDSKELLNEEEPQEFYDPFNAEEIEIEKYDGSQDDHKMFVSNNPYGLQPVLEEKVKKQMESNPLETVVIDVNNFTRK